MLPDTSRPLYTLTIGEFKELARQIILAVITEQPHLQIEPNTAQDEHLNIDQCAKFLGCSTVSIHNYKKQGLPFYRIGRKVLFKKSEVLSFMKDSIKKLRGKSK